MIAIENNIIISDESAFVKWSFCYLSKNLFVSEINLRDSVFICKEKNVLYLYRGHMCVKLQAIQKNPAETEKICEMRLQPADSFGIIKMITPCREFSSGKGRIRNADQYTGYAAGKLSAAPGKYLCYE